MSAAKPVGQVLQGVPTLVPIPAGTSERIVSGLEYDSRAVRPGFLFFAFPGAKVDGRAFARQAMDKGAIAVVSQQPAPETFTGVWIQVEHGRRALATAAKNFYDAPDERIALTGITGTNGKTTTSYLVDSVMRAAGRTTALIGTIEYHLAGRVMKAANTTPESLDLFRMLDELEREGGSVATMEVSSHALDLGRVHGLRFPYGGLYESHARPPGLPWNDGILLRCETSSVRAQNGSCAETCRSEF